MASKKTIAVFGATGKKPPKLLTFKVHAHFAYFLVFLIFISEFASRDRTKGPLKEN